MSWENSGTLGIRRERRVAARVQMKEHRCIDQLEVILRYRDHRESCRPRKQRLEGICLENGLHSVLGCLDNALLDSVLLDSALRGNEQEAHHASRSAKGSDRDSLKELEEPPLHPEPKTERNWGREDGGKGRKTTNQSPVGNQQSRHRARAADFEFDLAEFESCERRMSGRLWYL
jgi:hypothetical protein